METPPPNQPEGVPLPTEFAEAMLDLLHKKAEVYRSILKEENFAPLEKTIQDLSAYQQELVQNINQMEEGQFIKYKDLLLDLSRHVTKTLNLLHGEYNDRVAAAIAFSDNVQNYYQGLLGKTEKLIQDIERYQ